MTDRELLELAAKAAGFNFKWFKVKQWKTMKGEVGPCRYFTGTVDVYGSHHTKPWNPLKDDGDALRLAVKLQVSIENECVSAGCAYCTRGGFAFESVYSGGDGGCVVDADFSAVRRAIVIAAASIGKDMQ